MLNVVRLVVLLLVLLLGGSWAYSWATRAPGESMSEAFTSRLALLFGNQQPVPAMGGVQLPQGMALGGSFSLTDQTGKAVTEHDFAGRWMLLYFGYTYCPDVCPTELGTIAAAVDLLGPLADQVVPALVTIDPQRDTVSQLADYVSRFHPRMQGLTGTTQQIAEITKRYRVYYSRAQRTETTDYLMDHSSFVYLVGPNGRVRSLFRPEASAEDIANTIRAQMRQAGQPG